IRAATPDHGARRWVSPRDPGLSVTRAVRSARPAWWTWLLAFGALALVTVMLLLLRGRLDKAHIALAYLLVVLGGSAAGGGLLGVMLSGIAFLCFNYLFLSPYYTLAVADPRDWLVLIAF